MTINSVNRKACKIKRIPKWIWIICSVFIVMQYLICLNVYVMGDDYMYGTFSHSGIITSVFSYYYTGNGRWFINIIDSLCLLFDRYCFILICPWLLFLLGILMYRLVSEITGKKDSVILAASLILISAINVLMGCEVFYWITGSINYLIPALFLLGSMAAVVRMRMENQSKKDIAVCSLICIVSCMTMEQYALMSIGWMFLIWSYDCIKTKRINKTKVIVFLLCTISLATVLFAPANSIRVADAAEKETALFTKVVDLIYYDYYSTVSATFVFIFTSFCSYRLFCERKKLSAIITGTNAIIVLFVFIYPVFSIRGAIQLAIAFVSMLLSVSAVVSYLFIRKDKTDGLYTISLLIIGIGSQIMLLMTDLWGFRTSLCWIIIYIVIILTIIAENADAINYAVFSCIMCMAVNPYLGILAVMVTGFIIYRKKTLRYAAVILSVLTIIIGLSDEVKGYMRNGQIHRENILSAETADQNGIIIIHSYDDMQYGWSSPPFSDFHERYFRNYYRIPDNTSIIYEE